MAWPTIMAVSLTFSNNPPPPHPPGANPPLLGVGGGEANFQELGFTLELEWKIFSYFFSFWQISNKKKKIYNRQITLLVSCLRKLDEILRKS